MQHYVKSAGLYQSKLVRLHETGLSWPVYAECVLERPLIREETVRRVPGLSGGAAGQQARAGLRRTDGFAYGQRGCAYGPATGSQVERLRLRAVGRKLLVVDYLTMRADRLTFYISH